MEEKMIVPLFSYDTNTKQLDISCLGGDICCVSEMFTTPDDPQINIYKEKLAAIYGKGTKVVDVSNLSKETIRELMSFIDIILCEVPENEIDIWNNIYSILANEYQSNKSM